MTYPRSQCDPRHCTCYYGDTQGHANLHGVAGTCCFCGAHPSSLDALLERYLGERVPVATIPNTREALLYDFVRWLHAQETEARAREVRRSAAVWVVKLRPDGAWEFIPAGQPLGRECQRIQTIVEMPTSYATARDATAPQGGA